MSGLYNYNSGDRFKQLIGQFNDACYKQHDAEIEAVEKQLYALGAWVDSEDCWRHPDDHDHSRTLSEILADEETAQDRK